MRTPERILGTRLWCRWIYATWRVATNLEFIQLFEDKPSRNGDGALDLRTLRAWKKGRRYVQEETVHRLMDVAGEAWLVYSISKVLTRKYLSAPAVRALIKDFVFEDAEGATRWKFPRSADDLDAQWTCAWDDSAALARRQDFFGMMAILVLLRSRNSFSERKAHAMNLFRILPSVIRLPWVRPDADLLLQCIEDMQRGPFSILLYATINWEVFIACVEDPNSLGSQEKQEQIVDFALFLSERTWDRRPVPLLSDVEPLEPYVVRPKPKIDAPRRKPLALGRGLEPILNYHHRP